jgi:hypothetical protein
MPGSRVRVPPLLFGKLLDHKHLGVTDFFESMTPLVCVVLAEVWLGQTAVFSSIRSCLLAKRSHRSRSEL